jgi:Kef-type K+ transport system membrane component KefB
MTESARFFLALGGLFLIGLLTDFIGRRTPLPRVTMLLIFGFIVGPAVLDLLPDISREWFPIVADMALVMIGFLLGGKLTLPLLRKSGRQVLWISIMAVLVTALIVATGLLVLGQSLPVALLLAAIAPATAPASTIDVIQEAGDKAMSELAVAKGYT